MPLYEYQCETCAHRFEVIQKFSDAPIAVCPKCGGPVVKLLSSPAIQFKGSGWYITDYARQGADKGGDDKGGDKKTEKPGGPEAAPGDSSAKKDTTKSTTSETSAPTSKPADTTPAKSS